MTRESARYRPAAGIFLLSALLCSCGGSRRDEGAFREGGPPVFTETHNLISDKPGMSRLDINVVVPLNFFVFVRSSPESVSAHFVARSDVAVEILDKSRASVKRSIFRRELPSPDQTPNPKGEKFLQEMFSCDLPPGEYAVVTEVSDLESSRRFMDRGKGVALKDFSRGPLEISDAIFLADSLANDTGAVATASLGGDLPFGKRAYGYVEFASASPLDSVTASFTIRPVRAGAPPDTSQAGVPLTPVLAGNTRFLESVKGDESFSYRIVRGAQRGRYSVWTPALSDTLPQGSYEIETRVSAGAVQSSARTPFRIRWIDMPRSLRNFRLAVEALRYAAGDTLVSAIQSAHRDQQQAIFDAYWKRLDPTPATAFNERLAEYYTRADYAADNFGSLREPNGIRSDRGKAYILYGPPASIRRTLRPSSDPEEVWNYPMLHERLVFVDKEHHGEYKLVETGPL
jgi:GWxTD domain-containing protein